MSGPLFEAISYVSPVKGAGATMSAAAAKNPVINPGPDTKLYDFYIKRGFRFIEHWQWPYTNYRSCILSKRLEK